MLEELEGCHESLQVESEMDIMQETVAHREDSVSVSSDIDNDSSI